MWASGFYRHEYTYILKDTNLKTFLKEIMQLFCYIFTKRMLNMELDMIF